MQGPTLPQQQEKQNKLALLLSQQATDIDEKKNVNRSKSDYLR
jgi:hypothetical protein